MKVNFRTIFNKYYGVLTLLVIIGSALRLFNLGYSDYQGDEIKALFLPSPGQNMWGFLLEQRKGPLQFIITYLLKFLDPTYDNQFLMRLPFALAGIASIYFFYKIVKEHFGNRISLYATLFFLTNGFLIAFSRIVQYQSLVVCFMLAALYYFTIASSKPKFQRSGLYLGFLFWALSLLSHYDGVFIGPFVLYLLLHWWKISPLQKKEKITTILMSFGVFVLILCSFYIPFILSLSESTLGYWEGRLTGEVSGKIASSMYLFSVYQPIYVIHFYIILVVLGGILTLLTFLTRLPKVKIFINKLPVMTIFNQNALIALICWFIPAFLFMEVLVYIPGTHIYTYLIPLFIFLAFGIYLVENVLKGIFGQNIGRNVFIYGLILLFTFIYLQSYAIYVDNKVEYPWRDEKFFFWVFPKPNAMYHLSMFGFPYYRNWEGIRDFIKSSSFEPTINAYSTNERKSISRYYVDLENDANKAGVLIYIWDPQSYSEHLSEEKTRYWMETHLPEYTLSRNGIEIVKVYLMVPGTLQEIQLMGY